MRLNVVAGFECVRAAWA